MYSPEVDVICNPGTTKNCAIKLDGISCDGYNENTKIGVFSHFHYDHIQSVLSCINDYNVIIAHPLTFEGITSLESGIRNREQWLPQDYDTKYDFTGGTIRLLKANHIPGSAQVHVESDGKTMLYSGDFSYPDMQIRQADYLVIDSTHGDPWADGKADRESVKNRMFEYIEEQIDSHHQIVIQAPSGTLQELVRHFEIGYNKKLSEEIYFVMDKKQDVVLRNVYRAEKQNFRNIVEYDSYEFWKLVRNNKKCIIFSTHLKFPKDELYQYHKIMVDRWRFGEQHATIIPGENSCRFNLTAHSSITGIYEYIESVNPKYVITDYSRSMYAKQLAKLIKQKFPHIHTQYRPAV